MALMQTYNLWILDSKSQVGDICCCHHWKLLWLDMFELIIEVWLIHFSGRKL